MKSSSFVVHCAGITKKNKNSDISIKLIFYIDKSMEIVYIMVEPW